MNDSISPDVQARLNQPMEDPSGFEPADEAFLQDIVAKFDSGAIQRHSPSSLLNDDIYEKLEGPLKVKADQNAFNILARVRDIYDLWSMNPVATHQLKNQIHHIRLIKENLEDELGDVYIV